MKYTKYPELKAELKELAKEIRQFKDMRDHYWDYTEDQGTYQWGVQSRAYDFRHKHIAYCMLRGRKYEEIENYCREAPDFKRIDLIKLEHGQKTLRACA
jgi:hypothetical protein